MEKIVKIPVDKILANPFQPRLDFSHDKIRELAHSIKVNGLLQPITVRYAKDNEGYYEVIAGERRLRAVQGLKIQTIDCIIKNYDDLSTLRLTTIENLQREDLNSMEEARAFKTLKEKFGITQEQVSSIVSKSRAKIANSMRLLDLPKDVQNMIENGEISGSFGRTLLGLKDEELIIKWANDEKKSKLSVNQLEKEIKNFLNPKKSIKNETKIKVNNRIWKGSFDNSKKNINFTFKNEEEYIEVLKFIKSLEN